MNIIDAIINLVNNPVVGVKSHSQSNNRANQAGDDLEEYVKDLFSGSFNLHETQRIAQHAKVFSYLGNNSNPPDAMLRNGDAIEVKKIESKDSALALNSSHPKSKLSINDSMLTKACKDAEKWEEKDIIYIVGVVDKKKNLKHLAMVYGIDYCADAECYLKIKNQIKEGIGNIGGIQFAETKELGRVNRIDPLNITYLRVRGMWGIENPWFVFNYIYQRDMEKSFNFMAIINEDKWNSFNNTDKLLAIQDSKLAISDIKIKNPNNPERLRNAKLITYYL